MNRRLAILIAVVALLATSCRRGEVSTSGKRAPVILISIDTLRADHLPLFGYKDVETPNIDALRRDGILFTNAFCHVPLTLPSHVTVLTGLLPPDNKVRNNIGYKLDPAVPTLPGILKASGYATGASVSAYVLRGSTGLGPSFDFYDDAIASKPGTPVGSLQRSGKASEEIAARWIGENDSKPFFFFLHLFEPHSPYTPPEPFRSRFRLPYDGEIATADAIVGDLLDFLRKRGLYDKAIIVLMSDHGEGLYEHGEPEHGIFLYREAIHVPLIVKLP
ncbi:MAG TPA: sulfatase, partial [Thermoanaerobaculia bacterium]|nr:sulfatase [Thermoanaerobaculia bacterium]